MPTGYNPAFLTGVKLTLPKLTAAQKKLLAPLVSNKKQTELKYTHFSAVMNKERKFAFFVATNIDGAQWKAAVKDRIDFKKEPDMLPEFQIGEELYDFLKSRTNNDFDQGHIAKFQDPQWGDDATATKAAADTMCYPNCLPQHRTLNRGAWKSLEDYIVKQFTTDAGADGRKVTVFAGPVLSGSDPFYIDRIAGQPLRIPCFFWKVIVYRNKKNKLSAVAFMMSQLNILRLHNFVVDSLDTDIVAARTETEEPDFFENFKSGEPYQVRVDFVEQITGLKFSLGRLAQPYKRVEPTEIIYKRIEVPPAAMRDDGQAQDIPIIDIPLSFEFAEIAL